MTGALAAFVATPCTGPFMGAALGATLVPPWPAALAVFGGLGSSASRCPFCCSAWFRLSPHAAQAGRLDRTLRHILSVPMFLALALIQVLGRQAGLPA